MNSNRQLLAIANVEKVCYYEDVIYAFQCNCLAAPRRSLTHLPLYRHGVYLDNRWLLLLIAHLRFDNSFHSLSNLRLAA